MKVYTSIEDLRREAGRRVPKAFFEYVENGAFTATTLAANRADLDSLHLRQRLIVAAQDRSLATTMLGRRVSLPLALAPTGLCGAVHAQGEILAARAAQAFGVPFCLSTMSIAPIEAVAAAVGGDFWFQLYAMREERINRSLLARAKAAGCDTLVVTIDAQTEGTRYRDRHNGLGLPPRLTPGNIWGAISHPRWSAGMLLRSRRHTLGNLVGEFPEARNLAELAKLAKSELRPSIDAAFLAWARREWKGKLVIKGILDPADARAASDAGADAIVVSNHGGRQLEGAASTAAAFPAVRDATPATVELYVDSGVRTGIDILRFLALGARACLIGRAYLYGLRAGGEAGVTCALAILRDELDRTMALTGVADAANISPEVLDLTPSAPISAAMSA